jgi:hypothetical protein
MPLQGKPALLRRKEKRQQGCRSPNAKWRGAIGYDERREKSGVGSDYLCGG